jgi:hypothetical protein
VRCCCEQADTTDLSREDEARSPQSTTLHMSLLRINVYRKKCCPVTLPHQWAVPKGPHLFVTSDRPGVTRASPQAAATLSVRKSSMFVKHEQVVLGHSKSAWHDSCITSLTL